MDMNWEEQPIRCFHKTSIGFTFPPALWNTGIQVWMRIQNTGMRCVQKMVRIIQHSAGAYMLPPRNQ